MPNSDLLPSLLFKINENQLALEAAIMELTLWVEERGARSDRGWWKRTQRAADDRQERRVYQDDTRGPLYTGVSRTACSV